MLGDEPATSVQNHHAKVHTFTVGTTDAREKPSGYVDAFN